MQLRRLIPGEEDEAPEPSCGLFLLVAGVVRAAEACTRHVSRALSEPTLPALC